MYTIWKRNSFDIPKHAEHASDHTITAWLAILIQLNSNIIHILLSNTIKIAIIMKAWQVNTKNDHSMYWNADTIIQLSKSAYPHFH